MHGLETETPLILKVHTFDVSYLFLHRINQKENRKQLIVCSAVLVQCEIWWFKNDKCDFFDYASRILIVMVIQMRRASIPITNHFPIWGRVVWWQFPFGARSQTTLTRGGGYKSVNIESKILSSPILQKTNNIFLHFLP